MELRHLKAFVEVATQGSYVRAANTLGIAQSALSRQVSALERGIGGRLFHRTGRGVALTEIGERVLPQGRALIADATALKQAAQEPRATARLAKSRWGWCRWRRASCSLR